MDRSNESRRRGAGVTVDDPGWEPLVLRVCEMARIGLTRAPDGPFGPLPVPRNVYEELRPTGEGVRFHEPSQHAVLLPELPRRPACLVPYMGDEFDYHRASASWSLEMFISKLDEAREHARAREATERQVALGLLSPDALRPPERVSRRRVAPARDKRSCDAPAPCAKRRAIGT